MRGIKCLTIALAMFLGIGIAEADNKDKSDNGHNDLIEDMNEFSENAFIEAYGLNRQHKIFVYDLDGRLLLAAKETDLKAEQYKIIFQSDLIMESAGNQYYIEMNNKPQFDRGALELKKIN